MTTRPHSQTSDATDTCAQASAAEVAATAEARRLGEDAERSHNWKRWGPYVSERQWGTVREDYSADGSCWTNFPHEQARSRAYRWGEDGILGITDRECRMCFALAMWNGKDPILKERLFGLTGPQGNHGEDVKEEYFYLDSTPTHSYMKGLYKYPHAEYPYDRLVAENAARSKDEPEFELVDTGVFEENRYFDVQAEYAKADTDDLLIRVTVTNRGPERAMMHLLPTAWYRNTWSWGCLHEGCWIKPRISAMREAGSSASAAILGEHVSLGRTAFAFAEAHVSSHADKRSNKPATGTSRAGVAPALLFTDNESNSMRLWNLPSTTRFAKDAFHDYLVQGHTEAVNPQEYGTKVAGVYRLELDPGQSAVVRMRMWPAPPDGASDPTSHANDHARGQREMTAGIGGDFDDVFAQRIAEADEFYKAVIPKHLDEGATRVARQAYAGMMWSKQFYHYIVKEWLDGDPNQPTPPPERKSGRNSDWGHLFNRDVISMPDKWEYPWYAAWDLAFHVVGISKIDPEFAKQQLILMLREWYMHP
ncbi:MAG: hypothetical protein H7210_14265, partial [Pyrinomonadaceae bacterium]|nr:hypothetical protein [Phycisphaerales bacterium]